MSTAARLSEREYLAAERAKDTRILAQKDRNRSIRQKSFEVAVNWLDTHLLTELAAAASDAGPHVSVTHSDNFTADAQHAFKPPTLTVSVSRKAATPRKYEVCVQHGLISTFEQTGIGRRDFVAPDVPGPHLILDAGRVLARSIARHMTSGF